MSQDQEPIGSLPVISLPSQRVTYFLEWDSLAQIA